MRRPSPARAGKPAAQAEAAASAVMAWLGTKPHGQAGREANTAQSCKVWTNADAAAVAASPPSAATKSRPKPRDPAAPDATAMPADRAAPLRLPSLACSLPSLACSLAHTDWLYHRLQVSGPAADLAACRAAAAGAGVIPWAVAFDRMEEDLFHRRVAPPAPHGALTPPRRSLSLAGARILAGQLRAAAAHRHAIALARVGRSRACPFDLYALVPVPDAMLRRGPDDPDALAWLWSHWGTTQALRHVADDEAAGAVRLGQAVPGEGVWVLTFWSADWTPWRALAEIAAGWPRLRFDTRPRYDTR